VPALRFALELKYPIPEKYYALREMNDGNSGKSA
jgi:hypothetical protein